MWTREKHKEYRKLKRSGYSHKQLKEYFGDEIYESGIYNKNPSILGYLSYFKEIKVTPVKVDYKLSIEKSLYNSYGNDFIIRFDSNGITYVIRLLLFKINNLSTYNIIFTTEQQYNVFIKKFNEYIKKKSITTEEQAELRDVLEKETHYFDLYNVMRYISYCITDINPVLPKDTIFSIGDTDVETKINLYRSIIKDSFDDITEEEVYDSENNKYYIFKKLSN